MDMNRIIKSKSLYLWALLIAIIIASLILLHNQDNKIEVLARQLYSPKSLLYKQEKDLSLIASCTGGLSLPENNNSLYYLVQLTLENRTIETQEFITYSCSVLANVISDDKDITFFYQNCSSNYPISVKLKPKQQFELPVMIQVKRYSLNKKVRFGYVILRPENVRDEILRQLDEMRNNQKNVIWSNPIELNVTSYRPFKIDDIIIPVNPIQ